MMRSVARAALRASLPARSAGMRHAVRLHARSSVRAFATAASKSDAAKKTSKPESAAKVLADLTDAPVLPTTDVSAGESVSHLFETMDYGPAPESREFVDAWLESHDREFGLFINNQWVKPEGRERATSYAPATGEVLASTVQGTAEDVDSAVAAAEAALPAWKGLKPHVRARYLYAIARHLQKHHRLMAVLESMDNGKTVRETRDADVPLAVRHFYSHAGWAQLMDTEMSNYAPLGVVGQIIPWNFPLLMLAWKVAPALAMGNTLVIKPAPWTRLSAWLFAEICVEAGLPPGVVNIVSGDNDMADYMAGHSSFAKVAFTGSTPVGKMLRQKLAGTGRKMSLELGGKSPVIVYDSADLDSAVEGLVSAIWFNQGQVCCAGSRLLVQENVADDLVRRLKRRIENLRVGDSLDKAMDMGPVVDPVQAARVNEYLNIAVQEGAEVTQAPTAAVDPKGCYVPPTLVTNVQSTSRLVQEEIFGPVLVVQTFRTPSEAIQLANNSRFGLAAGVWSESIGLALETAISVRAGVVWVNCHNMFDAAAGFGGYKESGFGREGGKEGLFEYSQPKWQVGLPKPTITEAMRSNSKWGKAQAATRLPAAVEVTDSASVGSKKQKPAGETSPSIDRTPKMYIGGAQKRPDGAYSQSIFGTDGLLLGQVGDGNRKDIRDAVEAAHAAAPGWGKRAAYNRSQILFYIAENLSIREDEFAARIASMTGKSLDASRAEVQASISRLFTYAAWADKFGGTVQETPLYGLTTAIYEPVGVVGIVCPPADMPLLGFISLVAPAVVRGNTVVACPSEKFPLAATDLYQVLDTSDLPAGVINIVTGQEDVLAKTLAEHQDVDAMWYFGTAEGSMHVESLSADNVKRTFCSYGRSRDWLSTDQGEGIEFLREAVEVKNVWVPMGE